jgi:hypothetical protein
MNSHPYFKLRQTQEDIPQVCGLRESLSPAPRVSGWVIVSHQRTIAEAKRPCCRLFATPACLVSGVDSDERRVLWRGSGGSDGGDGHDI